MLYGPWVERLEVLHKAGESFLEDWEGRDRAFLQYNFQSDENNFYNLMNFVDTYKRS